MIPLVGYILVIVLANWAIQQFGLVPVGFGLMAPPASTSPGWRSRCGIWCRRRWAERGRWWR